MRVFTLFLAGLLAFAAPTSAAEGEEAPEFLLGDIGVRVDLP